MKKAQIETSFNWIFVAIAGSALFLFLIYIGLTTQSSTDETIQQTLTDDLYNELQTYIMGDGENSATPFTLRASYEFICDEAGHTLRDQTGYERNLDTQPIFTPPTLNEADLILQRLTYDMPHPMTKALLVSDTTKEYYFINDNQHPEIERLYNQLGDNFNKELRNTPPSTDNAITITAEGQGGDITINRTRRRAGGLHQYKIHINGTEYNVLDETPVLGAIISQTPDMYRCGFQTLKDSIKNYLTIEIARHYNLTKGDITTQCQTFYTADNPGIDQDGVIPTTEAYNDNIQTMNQTTAQLLELSNRLRDLNTEAQNFKCPTIY